MILNDCIDDYSNKVNTHRNPNSHKVYIFGINWQLYTSVSVKYRGVEKILCGCCL